MRGRRRQKLELERYAGTAASRVTTLRIPKERVSAGSPKRVASLPPVLAALDVATGVSALRLVEPAAGVVQQIASHARRFAAARARFSSMGTVVSQSMQASVTLWP